MAFVLAPTELTAMRERLSNPATCLFPAPCQLASCRVSGPLSCVPGSPPEQHQRQQCAQLQPQAQTQAAPTRRLQRPETMPCRFFLRGACARGSACLFSHSQQQQQPNNPGDASPPQVTTQSEARACAFFLSSRGCRFGDACRFAHHSTENQDQDQDQDGQVRSQPSRPLAQQELEEGECEGSEGEEGEEGEEEDVEMEAVVVDVFDPRAVEAGNVCFALDFEFDD